MTALPGTAVRANPFTDARQGSFQKIARERALGRLMSGGERAFCSSQLCRPGHAAVEQVSWGTAGARGLICSRDLQRTAPVNGESCARFRRRQSPPQRTRDAANAHYGARRDARAGSSSGRYANTGRQRAWRPDEIKDGAAFGPANHSCEPANRGRAKLPSGAHRSTESGLLCRGFRV